MKLASIATISALLSLLIAVPAFAQPDVYLVNFRHDSDDKSQQLDRQLPTALEISRINAEHVIIDTSTAAKWEKAAHDAFNRDIVSVFNKWVGLPGFVAVVDAKNKTLLGCLSADRDATRMAQDIQTMASAATGQARLTNASTRSMGTPCPATYNKPPE